ncbi:MAG: DUF1822 family protein [Symploca sp. SIO1C2]|nr:DUF1822 family protein [Symploca sp. SIO1C2]
MEGNDKQTRGHGDAETQRIKISSKILFTPGAEIMTNYFNEQPMAMKSFPGLPETIELEAKQQAEALEITNRLAAATGKLAIYYQALALVAFEDWLKKREPSLSVEKTEASLFNPDYAQAVNAVCNLRVGEFKICLLPTLGFSDELVTIPQAVLAIPEFAAHFYLIIGIEDELDLAGIRGVARYDQLAADIAGISVQGDGSYELPITSFSPKIEEFLVYLQCLSPATIKLPAVSTNRDYLEDVLKILTQQAINVRKWLQNQVDEVAQQFAWQPLPALSSLPRLRQSQGENLKDILTTIEVDIPAVAACSYRQLELAGTPLEFYAVTWPLPDASGDWSLLLIVATMPNQEPPVGVKLRVTDLTQVLEELEWQEDRDYLFMQIIGSEEEKFLATITAADGREKTRTLFESKS